MKTFKRIICVVLSLTMCLSSFIVFANAQTDPVDYYTTAGTATKNDIEISNNVLNKARKATKENKKSFTYTAVLNNQYDVHIYHFVAPSDGYYAFYTTGWKDTVIRIYEDQNFIFHNYKSTSSDWDDDSGRVDKNQFNGRVIRYLDAGEDYYVCVRVCYYFTGEYTLHIEPNDDKILSSKYGNCSKWTRISYSSSPLDYISTDGEKITSETRQYLTQQEVLLWGCYALIPDFSEKLKEYDKSMDLKVAYYRYHNGNAEAAIDIVNSIMELILTVCDIKNIGIPDPVSISVSALGTIFSYLYEASTDDRDEMREKLEKRCGFKYSIGSLSFVGNNSMSLNFQITCEKGAVVYNKSSILSYTDTYYDSFTQKTITHTISIPLFDSDIYGVSDTDVRTGVLYAKGYWTD